MKPGIIIELPAPDPLTHEASYHKGLWRGIVVGTAIAAVAFLAGLYL